MKPPESLILRFRKNLIHIKHYLQPQVWEKLPWKANIFRQVIASCDKARTSVENVLISSQNLLLQLTAEARSALIDAPLYPKLREKVPSLEKLRIVDYLYDRSASIFWVCQKGWIMTTSKAIMAFLRYQLTKTSLWVYWVQSDIDFDPIFKVCSSLQVAAFDVKMYYQFPIWARVLQQNESLILLLFGQLWCKKTERPNEAFSTVLTSIL